MLLIIIVCVIVLVLFSIWYFIKARELYHSDYILSGNNHLDIDKLMIVAHPDDELIFGGRELLSEPGWLVVCVTNGTSNSGNVFSFEPAEKRCHEFIKVANLVGFRYEMWDFEDNGFNANWSDKAIRSMISRLLSRQSYKKIVTHNLDGEYGHIQHQKISQVVHDLKPQNLHVFTFTDDDTANPNLPNNPYIVNIEFLLTNYKSQSKIINKYRTNLLYQGVEPVVFAFS